MNQETGKRLYEYRRANGYSQEAIARLLGVSRQAVSKWERGESSPDTDNLIALSQIYNVTIDEMIKSDSEPRKSHSEQNEEKCENTENTTEETVSFKNGIHVHNGRENVDISLKGIHVESENGDKVHIGRDCGIQVESKDSKMVTNGIPEHPWLHAVIPLLSVLVYLILGFTTEKGWSAGWLIFLLIPVAETFLNAVKSKDPSYFAYPVVTAVLFVGTGILFGVWHPTWILFVTIPIYYAVCDGVKKCRKPRNAEEISGENCDCVPQYKTGSTVITIIASCILCAIFTAVCILIP
ncbi:MAG: helix-turn-helix domain-containing protein [Eubacterium sp.]